MSHTSSADELRGRGDFLRGVIRHANPFTVVAQEERRRTWFEGWDSENRMEQECNRKWRAARLADLEREFADARGDRDERLAILLDELSESAYVMRNPPPAWVALRQAAQMFRDGDVRAELLAACDNAKP